MNLFFKALAHEARRNVIRTLAEEDNDRLDKDEFPGTETQASLLKHNHFPRLAEANIIEWDFDGRYIRKGEDFDAALAVLRKAEEVDPTTGRDMDW